MYISNPKHFGRWQIADAGIKHFSSFSQSDLSDSKRTDLNQNFAPSKQYIHIHLRALFAAGLTAGFGAGFFLGVASGWLCAALGAGLGFALGFGPFLLEDAGAAFGMTVLRGCLIVGGVLYSHKLKGLHTTCSRILDMCWIYTDENEHKYIYNLQSNFGNALPNQTFIEPWFVLKVTINLSPNGAQNKWVSTQV